MLDLGFLLIVLVAVTVLFLHYFGLLMRDFICGQQLYSSFCTLAYFQLYLGHDCTLPSVFVILVHVFVIVAHKGEGISKSVFLQLYI